METVYRGSSKNLWSEGNSNQLLVEFLDQYSVFDFGEMPDHIPLKGESSRLMTKLLLDILKDPEKWKNWNVPLEDSELEVYKRFCKEGICHHLLGGEGKFLTVVNVQRPEKIQTTYDMNAGEWVLVPLEVIYRLGVPQGSSLVRRATPQVLSILGLDRIEEGTLFQKPYVEFSTKLEPLDRFVDENEAMLLTGFSQERLDELKIITQLIGRRLKGLFNDSGVELWDGKLEFAWNSHEKKFMLVDSIGADEFRAVYKGLSLSKEIFRQYYRKLPWYEELQIGRSEGQKVKSPPHLPQELKKWGGHVYPSLTKALYVSQGLVDPFPEVLDLCSLEKKLREVL